MIKFRHSVFALPFALASMLVAAGGWPKAATAFWIVVACVAARSMAMTYNRLVDREIDARNPRTKNRALPAGLVSPAVAWQFTVAAGVLFVLAAGMLNLLCLALAPAAVVVLLGYSHCKRYTEGVHLILGLALALAPLGAWIAVRGSLRDLPIFLALGVMFWTAGFDVIYSCLDVACDRREHLRSLPARVGVGLALRGAGAFHVASAVCLALFLLENRLGGWGWSAWVAVSILLVLEHRRVGPNDLSKVGTAFFSFNALVSVVFLLGCALDVLL